MPPTIPISFERNQGQVPSPVRFLARGEGYRLYLGQDQFEVVLLARAARQTEIESSSNPNATRSVCRPRAAVLRASLTGACPGAGPEPVHASSAVNYFLGSDSSTWLRDVPAFERVQYRGVYPGIDLVFYGNQQSLEYDFIVGPGADPERIILQFDGAESAELDGGDLVLHCRTGDFRHHRPVLYQIKNGCRVPVQGEYVLRESKFDSRISRGFTSDEPVFEVRFEVGEYDHQAPLWIDPVLDYGTFLGGSSGDSGQGIAVDASGNMYITGQTVSTDFPTTVGAYDSTCGTDGLCNGAHFDVFVTKLNAAGTTRVYSTYLGGSGDEQSWGIAVDSAGRAHIMGWTTSTNFPTRNAFQSALAGSRDAFVTSFDSGGGLLYSTYLGGSSDMDADIDGGIAVDPQGKVYVTGRTASPDFPVRNAFQNPNGGLRAFLAKFDPLLSGSASLLYSTCLGGSADSGGTGIAVDSSAKAYITGYTGANDFPVKGAAQPTFGGIRDSFVAKFDPTKSGAASLIYATYLGGTNEEAETSGDIAVDSLGQAWVTGATRSGDFPTTNRLQAYAGDWDVYVTKLSASGGTFLFSTFLGGSGADGQLEAHIAVDSSGNAYVAGHTFSSDFPVTQGAPPAPSVDTVYVAKFAAAGTRLSYSLALGAGEARGIAVDSAQNVYVTGQTADANFPTRNALQPVLSGPSDAFVVRLRPSVNDVAVQVTPSLPTIGLGQDVIFIVTATNSGPDPAGVIVSNFLPAGLSFLNFPADCSYFGNEVDSPFLQLASHGARTLFLRARPTAIGSLAFRAALQRDDGDINAANDSVVTNVSVFASNTAPAPAALRMRDWDFVALKANTGEIVDDTQTGILGSPMGILGGAVNLMVTNRSRALFLAQGPSGDSMVAFGFINKTNWIPANHDENDLTSVGGDRVFATVDGLGNVTLVSAAAFSSGVVLATNHVALSPNSAFRLVIDPVQDLVRLYYGGAVVAQGNPFTGPDEATRALVGNDFAVSILGGTGDLGYTILNDRPLVSPVRINAIRPIPGNQLQITFQDNSSGAASYSIVSSTSLTGNWTPVASATITSLGAGAFQATFPRPAANTGYYRVQLFF